MKGSPAWGSLKVARPSQVWRRKDSMRAGEWEREWGEEWLAQSLNGLRCYYVKLGDERGCVGCLTVNSREPLCGASEEIVIFMDTLLD